MDKYESRYRSRKFILTSTVVVLACGMGLIGKMDGSNVAMIFTTAIAAYNFANAWQNGRG